MTSDFQNVPHVYEGTFEEGCLPSSGSPDHPESSRNMELLAVKKIDLRMSILSCAAYLLREMSGEDFCSIPINEDDPSAIRLRRLALEMADALESINL